MGSRELNMNKVYYDMREKTMMKPIVFSNAFMLIKETISKSEK